MKRKFYNFKELVKEIPELEQYSNYRFSDSVEYVYPLLDNFAEKNNLELVHILTPHTDCATFVFNEKEKEQDLKEYYEKDKLAVIRMSGSIDS